MLQALLAVHVETLEQPWLFVWLQTYPTGDLVLDLLESFLSSSGGFGSHGSSTTDKLERGSSGRLESLLKQEDNRLTQATKGYSKKTEANRKQPLSFYHFNIIHSLSVASVTFLTLFGDVNAVYE